MDQYLISTTARLHREDLLREAQQAHLAKSCANRTPGGTAWARASCASADSWPTSRRTRPPGRGRRIA